MANEKVFQSRIQLKHDIEENWLKATNFVPKEGEIIIYDVDANNPAPRFKVGDGTTVVNSLPFMGTQTDWNQNDETALDYVKNRTHWVEAVYEIIVPETTETAAITPLDNKLFNHSSYIVTVDGVEYQCTLYFNEMQEPSLGDSRLYIDNDNSNPIDVPFCAVSYIESALDSISGESFLIDVFYPDSETHTIEIKKSTGNTIYHALNENYIPETIARTSDVNEAINAASITALTEEEIDEICDATIEYAEEVMF